MKILVILFLIKLIVRTYHYNSCFSMIVIIAQKLYFNKKIIGEVSFSRSDPFIVTVTGTISALSIRYNLEYLYNRYRYNLLILRS